MYVLLNTLRQLLPNLVMKIIMTLVPYEKYKYKFFWQCNEKNTLNTISPIRQINSLA